MQVPLVWLQQLIHEKENEFLTTKF